MLGRGGPSGDGFSGFLPLGLAPQLKEQDMQVVNQARYQRCARAMERVAEIAPSESEPGLVAFPCSDCGSTARALVLLAMGDLRYARFNTNGQDLAARAGE